MSIVRKKNIKLVVTTFFLFIAISYASPDKPNSSLWAEAQLNYKLSKKFEASFAQQIRHDISNDATKWFVTDFELSSKINKKIKLSTRYRYKYRDDAKQHMVYANFNYQTKKKPLNLKYRLRFNKKIPYGKKESIFLKKRDEAHIRNRVIVELKRLKNWTPYMGTEIFYLVNNEKYGSGLDIFRYYLGLEIDVFKRQKIELSWVYEEVFNLGKPNKENIFKLQYSYDIN